MTKQEIQAKMLEHKAALQEKLDAAAVVIQQKLSEKK
jgi:hypothetical protein